MAESTVNTDRFRAFERDGHDRVARTYRDFFTLLTARAVEPLLDQAGVGCGQRVLDLATGPGLAAAAAAERGASVIGVDLSPAMIAVARERHPHLEFEQADAEDLPFEEATFDAVVCNFGLGHFPDALRAMVECARVLRPGGRAAVSWWNTPDVSRLNGVLLEAVDEVGAPPPDDLPLGPPMFRYSDDDELVDLLRSAGLEPVPPVTASTTHLLDSADQLWFGALNSMVRLSATIRGQPEPVQHRIRAAFERRVQPFVSPEGVRIPVSFKIASGTKPASSGRA